MTSDERDCSVDLAAHTAPQSARVAEGCVLEDLTEMEERARER